MRGTIVPPRWLRFCEHETYSWLDSCSQPSNSPAIVQRIRRSEGSAIQFSPQFLQVPTRAFAWVLLGSNQFDAVAGPNPGIAGHATHGIQPGGVDTEIIKEVFADVKANHLAQHNDAAAREMAGVDDLH